MIKCPFCGTSSVENTLFCSECGLYLINGEDRATDPLEDDEAEVSPVPEEEKTRSQPAKGQEPHTLRLKIGDRQRKVEVSLNKTIHLGRIDPGSDVFPEIDLTEHAPAKNISRRHASIRTQDGMVVIEDLGSINGTFLNGDRLSPYLPQLLKNGDSLYLGKLRIDVEILLD